jgi:ComF family protein
MELLHRWINHLFPSRCILCQQTIISAAGENIEICTECYSGLPVNDHYCIHCALPLPEEINEAVLCGRCVKKTPKFDYCISPFRYEDRIIRLVHQLKFAEKIGYARSMGEVLFSEVQTDMHFSDGKPECLLPVPLHNKRLRQRGYNQSIEICRVLSKKLGIPIEFRAVKRQRPTDSQTGLDAKQRQKNIRGAFQVSGKLPYRHVLIVDDVVTTGATVNELARVLKQNKVTRVGVMSFARAPLKN